MARRRITHVDGPTRRPGLLHSLPPRIHCRICTLRLGGVRREAAPLARRTSLDCAQQFEGLARTEEAPVHATATATAWNPSRLTRSEAFANSLHAQTSLPLEARGGSPDTHLPRRRRWRRFL